MKLLIHGAGQEVGRSCLQLQTAQTRILLDAGVKLTEHGSEFPIGLTPEMIRAIDAVLISHAHLDHTGALPLLESNGFGGVVIATKTTKALTKVLLEDAFKIGQLNHEHLGYSENDIDLILKFMQRIRWKEKGNIKDIEYEFFDAGHIPGSSSIQIVAEKKRIVYTGDIRSSTSQLMNPADLTFDQPIDVLITESTYGDREHPLRSKTEQEFLDAVRTTVDRGGNALVPCFGVGRAQELLLILSQEEWEVPVYVDGMAKEVTELLFEYPQSVKNAGMLRKAFSAAKPIKGHASRQSVTRRSDQQGIFLTTSGMLTGGPVMEYLKLFAMNPKNSILLTGYQGEGTNGRMLLEQRCVFIDGWKALVKAEVKQFDFSAHSGSSDLKRMIRQLQPKRLVVVHGDPSAAQAIADWAKALDIPATAPKNGEVIEL